MRQVGDLAGRQRAERFVAFLAAQGIDAQAREDGADRFSVWVIDEDRLPAADEHFRAYKAAPDAQVFNAPARPAAAAATQAPRRSRYIDVRTEVFGRGRARQIPVTMALIAASVLATLISADRGASGIASLLYFSEAGIRDGQVWRLVTPVFMHANLIHLLFNMLWLYQLGGMIETNERSRYFAPLVVLLAVLVDTAQYLWTGNPYFVGMSGVVYALFGYVWMMAKYQAGTRYWLARETVIIMLVWLVLCMTPLMENVANTEHIAGLVLGVAWGFLRSGKIGSDLRRRRYRG